MATAMGSRAVMSEGAPEAKGGSRALRGVGRLGPSRWVARAGFPDALSSSLERTGGKPDAGIAGGSRGAALGRSGRPRLDWERSR